ncbi:DNA-binding protein HU-beta [Holospora obtusa F1]|uniref:DNA-binding protein HU-beta n=1 Tax=Holospora obtusa F1 TaxID=1399147 RepID=W6TH30_HOLOB|nr:HU family DNA-binding protein [Holospora obtusa]ETZ07250.1 DNA-binding protein HU-beta [Holospora obtusa F1]
MKIGITKIDLVTKISASSGISKSTVNQVLDQFLEVVTETLKEGNSVRLTGFGSFLARLRPEMTARNPKTGAPVIVPAVLVPVFRAGKHLKSALESISTHEFSSLEIDSQDID